MMPYPSWSQGFTVRQAKVFIFFCIFAIVLTFPLIQDDVLYSLFAALQQHQLWLRVWANYMDWTGRLFAQVLIYSFLNQQFNFIEIPLIAGITAGFFLLFLRLSYRIVFQSQAEMNLQYYLILTLALILYLLLCHDFFEVIAFKTPAIQYFWVIVFVAWLLEQLSKVKPNVAFWHLELSFILGLLIGLSNEIVVLCVFFYLALIWRNALYNQRLRAFCFGLCFGFFVLMIAPGNQARMVVSQRLLDISGVHFSWMEKLHILLHDYASVPFKWVCFVLVLGLLIWVWKTRGRPTYALKWLAGAIFSLLILWPVAYCYDGVIAGRVTFISDLLLFYTLACLWVETGWRLPFRIHTSIWALALALCFVLLWYDAYQDRQFDQARIALIQSTPDAAHHDFVFHGFCPKPWFFFNANQLMVESLGSETKFWKNQAYALYYGAGTVRQVECAS